MDPKVSIRKSIEDLRISYDLNYVYEFWGDKHTLSLLDLTSVNEPKVILKSPDIEIIDVYLKGLIASTPLKVKRLNINIPEYLHDALHTYCKEREVTVTEIVSAMIHNRIY